jgi:hypothetical protein
VPTIVDTYNVLHVQGVLPRDLAGLDTAGLVRLTAPSRFAAELVLMVCDGTPPPEGPAQGDGAIRVRYAGPGRSADDEIIQLVARSSSPRRLTVVSSDREIQKAARRRRCRVLGAAAFLECLAEDAIALGRRRANEPLRPRSLSSDAVDRWLAEFDVRPEDLTLPPEPERPTASPAAGSGPVDAEARAEPVDEPRDLPGVELPASLLEEAEELWRSRTSPLTPRRSPGRNDPPGPGS